MIFDSFLLFYNSFFLINNWFKFYCVYVNLRDTEEVGFGGSILKKHIDPSSAPDTSTKFISVLWVTFEID